MQRACFLLRVKKGRLQEYLKAHDPVWPEMLDAIRDAGIRNYSMFHSGDGLLVGYMEGDDIEASLRKIGETDVSRRWEEGMAPFFEGGSGDRETGPHQWLMPYFYTT